jgi:hypothetical protein
MLHFGKSVKLTFSVRHFLMMLIFVRHTFSVLTEEEQYPPAEAGTFLSGLGKQSDRRQCEAD